MMQNLMGSIFGGPLLGAEKIAKSHRDAKDAERTWDVRHTGANRAERRAAKRAGKYVPRVRNTPLETRPGQTAGEAYARVRGQK